MKKFDLCDKRKAILEAQNHILVEGGPGSGKTTIALLKAQRIIENNLLKPNQKILFLSFARATISRIEEQGKHLFAKGYERSMEINTYHGFTWTIIQSFGYLLSIHRSYKLITPPNLAAKLAGIPNDQIKNKKYALRDIEGILCFDLFAETAAEIFKKSKKISNIISNAYPYVIVDEFQDTDSFEWELIKKMGEKSVIIALADLEQRIYDFRGASVARIPEFIQNFKCEKFDLGKENNRSKDTDIAQYGDDLLTGLNKNKQYSFVKIIRYPFYKGDMQRINLQNAVFNSIKRLNKSKPDKKWSIAILVKSKLDTLSISNYLTAQKIEHEVLIDPAGPSLAASLIASVLEPVENINQFVQKFLKYLVDHIRGRKGDKSTIKDLELATALENYLLTGLLKGVKRKALIEEVKQLASIRNSLNFIGIPEDDWIPARNLFQNAVSECLQNVFEDAKYLKLLHRGALLSERLSNAWRQYGNYSGAKQAIEDALTQEHFSMSTRSWTGIFVMNIHKSKGKEFDEVIIWEENYKPFVYPNSIPQGKLLLRVAITRARSYTTLLTPALNPCILL